MNKKLLRNTTIVFIIIGILNYIGNKLLLFWTTWWHDMILHFLAGFVISMSVVLFYQAFLRNSKFTKKNIVLISILASLIIGVFWEIFEIYFSITSLSDGLLFWRDTISDIILDILGAFFGIKHSIFYIDK